MKNPYIVDHPLTDKDLFHGREESFDRLGDYLGIGQRLILLYGKPRIGKTSFLNQLPTYLGTHYLVRRLEWTLVDNAADPLWRIMVSNLPILIMSHWIIFRIQTGRPFFVKSFFQVHALSSGP